MNTQKVIDAILKDKPKKKGKKYMFRKPATEDIHKKWVWTAADGDNKKLRKLVGEYQIDVNYTDKNGENALHYATWHGQNHTIIQLLSGYGVKINHPNKEGKTALDIAKKTQWGNQAATNLLISRGAKTGEELTKE